MTALLQGQLVQASSRRLRASIALDHGRSASGSAADALAWAGQLSFGGGSVAGPAREDILHAYGLDEAGLQEFREELLLERERRRDEHAPAGEGLGR